MELLGTKEMRQGANSRGGAQGGPEDAAEVEATERGEASGAATAARQRTRVMTQLMKHQLVENTIPIMIELKRRVQRKCWHSQGVLPPFSSLTWRHCGLLLDYTPITIEVLEALAATPGRATGL